MDGTKIEQTKSVKKWNKEEDTMWLMTEAEHGLGQEKAQKGSEPMRDGRCIVVRTVEGRIVESIYEDETTVGHSWDSTVQEIQDAMDEKAIQQGERWANRKTQFLWMDRKLEKHDAQR